MAAPQQGSSREDTISEITSRFSALSVTNEPTYSRDEAVSEITSFYKFLVKLFLPEDAVIYPPAGGWTEINPANIIPPIDDTVFDLLRHLPYIRQENDDEPWLVYPATVAINYTGEYYKKYGPWEPGNTTELTSLPPHVAQLAYSKGRDGFYMFLDTKRGTVTLCDYMYGPKPMDRKFPVPKNYSQEPDELGLPDETWREYETYAIRDFFELLKNEYKVYDYIVIDPQEIVQYSENDEETNQQIAIYREFGWPGDDFRKKECLERLKQIY